MAVAYEQYEGTIEAETESIDSEDPQEGTSTGTRQHVQQAEFNRRRLLRNGWPHKIGSVLLFFGCSLIVLGFLEVVVVPLVEANTAQVNSIHLNRGNLYGTTIWAGTLVFITACVGLRSTVTSSVKQVYLFFTLVMLNVLVYTGVMVLCLIGYVSGWTTTTGYQAGSALFALHMTCVAFMIGSFICIIIAFVQYYEDVLFGEPQMCRRWVHCCCPCWCPRAVDQEELLQEDYSARPPSLPV